MYSTGRSINGSSFAISLAISFRVLSVTSCPSIFSVIGAIPKNSQPPAVLRKAQAERIPSFNSPVVFFISNVRVSSPRMITFTSSIVITVYIFTISLAKLVNSFVFFVTMTINQIAGPRDSHISLHTSFTLLSNYQKIFASSFWVLLVFCINLINVVAHVLSRSIK